MGKVAQKNNVFVGIGMPVFNGANYVRRAIDSLLCQTYADFELLIVDNCSDDETARICKEYSEKDRRVRYICNQTNLGAAANFNRAFQLSKGKYFKWAAHDDELAPQYLECCLEQLEKNREIVLCHSAVAVIDENSNRLRIDRPAARGLQAERASQRFSTLLENDLHCYEVFGVIRRDILEKTSLIGGYVASDRILRAQLGLFGPMLIVDEPLFANRHHGERSICKMPGHHQRGDWFDPVLKGRKLFPHWKIMAEYVKVIRRFSFLGVLEKLRCYGAVVRWLFRNWNIFRLGGDIVLYLFPGAEKMIMTKIERRVKTTSLM